MENSGKAPTMRLSTVQTDEEAGKAWAEEAGPLQECGEIAASRLCSAFLDALNEASEQLVAKGTAGTASPEQRLWRESADFTMNRRQDMVDRFRKHFEQRYSQACRRKSVLMTGHVLDFDVRRLRIVEHDVLENGLDSTAICEAIRNGSWNALHELTNWFRGMLSNQELIPNDMPLGSRLIGGAVTDAINDQFGGHEIKQRLLRALCRTFPERVDRICRDLVGYLASAGLACADDPKVIGDILTPDRDVPDPASAKIPDMHGVGASLTLESDIGDNTETDEVLVDAAENKAERESSADTLAAGEVIDHRLANKRLPRFIADFLDGPWRVLLIGIHRENGASSPEWEAALRTMDDLVRSLRSKRAPEERVRMMGVLPDLVKRLERGLETLNEPIESQHRFFAHLAECHVRILGASRPPARLAESKPSADAPPPRVHDQAERVPADTALNTLEPGVWLEFRGPYSAPRKLKLAWISPQRNLFLLTNHLGERALSLGSKDFATLLQEGGARIIPPPNASTIASDTATPASHDKKTA
jgi:hypothetical protein